MFLSNCKEAWKKNKRCGFTYIFFNWNFFFQKVLQEDGQCCSPFIVAARFGHNRVVKMLLDKFKLDIEQEGRVKFDGYIIEGASALWCAAGKILLFICTCQH